MSMATALHRGEIGLIARLVAVEVSSIAGRADLDDVDAWFDAHRRRMVDVVADGYDATARLGGQYMALSAAVEGATVERVRSTPNLERIGTSLRVTGPVAFKRHLLGGGDVEAARRTMVNMTRGSSTRLVLAGSRDTVRETIRVSPQVAGYRRVTQPGACDFCVMLASRGGVYKTRGSAGSQEAASAFHDSCRCVVEPLWTVPG